MTASRLKKTAGTFLHIVATWSYVILAGFIILLLLEIWKGVVIFPYIHDVWISFGGAREVLFYAIFALVFARLVDIYSHRLNRGLKQNWRGWRNYD